MAELTEQASSGIVMVNLAELTIHPLAAKMPMLPADAPERVALRQSIELHGLGWQPIIRNARNEIMDGRHRRDDARRVGLLEVPCITRPDEEAGAIIVASLIGRRHYGKSALAYLSFPLLEDTRQARQEARRRGLLSGKSLRSSTQSTDGKTVEELAVTLGFGRDMFFMAQAIHRKFEAADRARDKWRAENPERAAEVDEADSMWFEEEWAREVPVDLRAEYEPKILSGERSLGDVQKAIGGMEATLGRPKATPPKADLFLRGVQTLQTRFGYWEEMTTEEQSRGIKDLYDAMPASARQQFIELASRAH